MRDLRRPPRWRRRQGRRRTQWPTRTATPGSSSTFTARWRDAGEDERCIAWARRFFEATAPHATGGVYVNFLTADEQDRVRAAYGANYNRLAALKAKYDPDNLFQVNFNVRPAA